MFFGTVERPPRLSEFEFEIPEKLIAQHPSKKRDECKLMVVNKETGEIQHKIFSDIAEYFNKGDVLVLNNTKVFSARLYANKDKSTAKVEVFLLRELENDLWEAMVKPARKVRIGNKLIFDKNISCDVIDNTVSGGRVLRFEYNTDSLYPFIDKKGRVDPNSIKIIKGIPALNDAAILAVKKSKWKPAQQRDKKVGVYQTVPIKFELK